PRTGRTGRNGDLMAYLGGFLTPWFDEAPNHRAMKNIIRVGITYANQVAMDHTPVQTGDLREAWETGVPYKTMSFLGMAWEGQWQNSLDYAEYVNYGTGLYGP